MAVRHMDSSTSRNLAKSTLPYLYCMVLERYTSAQNVYCILTLHLGCSWIAQTHYTQTLHVGLRIIALKDKLRLSIQAKTVGDVINCYSSFKNSSWVQISVPYVGQRFMFYAFSNY